MVGVTTMLFQTVGRQKEAERSRKGLKNFDEVQPGGLCKGEKMMEKKQRERQEFDEQYEVTRLRSRVFAHH